MIFDILTQLEGRVWLNAIKITTRILLLYHMNLYTYIYLNNEERFAASIWGVSIASVFEKSSNALPTFLPYNSEECDPPPLSFHCLFCCICLFELCLWEVFTHIEMSPVVGEMPHLVLCMEFAAAAMRTYRWLHEFLIGGEVRFIPIVLVW